MDVPMHAIEGNNTLAVVTLLITLVNPHTTNEEVIINTTISLILLDVIKLIIE
jgi:hypothetical protein